MGVNGWQHRLPYLVLYVQIESVCRHHLEEWAAADRAIDIAIQGRELAFDFSTQLLVSP